MSFNSSLDNFGFFVVNKKSGDHRGRFGIRYIDRACVRANKI